MTDFIRNRRPKTLPSAPSAAAPTTVDGITDAGDTGRAIMRAADPATVRTAAGAAAAIDLAAVAAAVAAIPAPTAPTVAGITDAGAAGRNVLRSDTMAAAQTALLGALVRYVSAGESIADAITAGYRNIYLQPGATYTVDDLVLPAGTTINGMQATLSPSDSTHACILLHDGSDDVAIDRVRFLGQSASPNGTAYNKAHWAIKVSRAFRPCITRCTFANWAGGGIGMVGSAADDYKEYGANISDNEFNRCFIGFMRCGRYEFGRDSFNRHNNCRVGVWDEAGNWTTIGTKATSCRTPYVSTNRAIDFTAGGVNAFSSNSAHGTLVGIEGNHANDEGGSAWAANNAIPLMGGGTYTPPGGIVIDGVLPPTMTGLTLYYCDLTLLNRPTMSRPTRISGVVASTCTISADVAGVLELDGYTDHSAVTLTNVTVTDDRVASTTQLGQIKLGAGFSIDAEGVASVNVGRTTTNVSSPVTEYGFNSQLGDGKVTTQGWTEIGNNPAVTDPAAALFAGTATALDGGIQSLVALDKSGTHNPTFGLPITTAQRAALYATGGTMRLRWRPYTIAAGSCGLMGISFPAAAGFAGWTGIGTINQWYISPALSAINGNLATIDWKWNGATGAQVTTNVDCSVYHDVEVRMYPGQNRCQLLVDGVQVGGDLTWGTISNVVGANFANKLFWAAGGTGTSTVGMWIRQMSAFLNGDLGSMTTPASDVDTVFAVPSDWRDYTLTIRDQAYAKFATIKGTVSLPVGRKLTITRASNNVLINGGGSDVVINGTGSKQTVSLTQQIGATGKQWTVD